MNLKKKTVHTLGSSSNNNDKIKSRSISSVGSKYPVLRVGKNMLELLEKDFPELLK